MNFEHALGRMRSPHQMGVICIDVTNKCDLACSNCTRLLKNQEDFWDMRPDNFRRALRSLEGFKGTIAVIGGNPCMHPRFETLCEIIVEEIPDKWQRGLWSNNVFKFQELVEETFGQFNLNPHGDARSIKSLDKLKQLVPSVAYWKGHSHHAPLLTAVRDLFPEAEMWDRISKCDVNQEWSATLIENRGQLRAYFCEVAASFDLARGDDYGLDPDVGWWRMGISEFSSQVKKFCPGCGVPARLKGSLDVEETDQFTETNRDLAESSVKRKRKVIEIKPSEPLEFYESKVVDYTQAHLNARKPRFLRRLKALLRGGAPRS